MEQKIKPSYMQKDVSGKEGEKESHRINAEDILYHKKWQSWHQMKTIFISINLNWCNLPVEERKS